MRRPVPVVRAGAGGADVALALPATELHLTGGDNRGIPLTTEATRGLQDAGGHARAGRARAAPDRHRHARAGGVYDPAVVAAQRRLVAELRRDPEVEPDDRARARRSCRARVARQANLVDDEGRVAADPRGRAQRRRRGPGRWTSCTASATATCRPPASRRRPTSCSPARPPSASTSSTSAYSAFPWLVLAVLVITYLLLLRAFRSVFLPLKAVIMNLLSVAATYGVLMLAFQHGWGEVIGLQQLAADRGVDPDLPVRDALRPVDGLRGLPALPHPRGVGHAPRQRARRRLRARAHRPDHHRRAIIMIAAFSGFTSGSFVGLQEFGLGLSAAILLDATLVRAVLVPAVMKIIGRVELVPAGARAAGPARAGRAGAGGGVAGLRGRAPRPRGAGAAPRAAGRGPARRRRPSRPGCARSASARCCPAAGSGA